MFLDWFDYEVVQSSNLLGYLNLSLPARNAWDALSYIPVVLALTVGVALITAVVRLGDSATKPPVRLNAAIGVLGLVSVLLIGFRIIEPPDFVFHGYNCEATIRPPIFLALGAAAGIAVGGFWSMRQGIQASDP